MIKNGIKNYFKSLKYFFVPLGTMFLGILAGLSLFAKGMTKSISQLVNEIKLLSENFNFDFNTLGNYLWEAIRSLDWTEPNEAFKIMISSQWLDNILSNILKFILGEDFEIFKEQIVTIIKSFTTNVVVFVFLFFLCLALSFIVGSVIMRFFVKHSIVKKSFFKFLISTIINAVFSVVVIIICFWLFSIWKKSIFISAVFSLLIISASTLIQAYLIHGFKIIKLKKVLNLKNIGLYILTNTIIFLITVILSLFIISLNSLIGIFVFITLIEISFAVMGTTAEEYVKNIVVLNEK